MDFSNTLIIVGANLALIVSMIGTVVALHIQSTNLIAKINDEMKEFHGKMAAIEERRKHGG